MHTSTHSQIHRHTHTHTNTYMYIIHIHLYVYIRVYQNLATSSENYKTFPKVGPHYKEKACKFLARSDYSLRPNSCVLLEIFVARRKITTAQ